MNFLAELHSRSADIDLELVVVGAIVALIVAVIVDLLLAALNVVTHRAIAAVVGLLIFLMYVLD